MVRLFSTCTFFCLLWTLVSAGQEHQPFLLPTTHGQSALHVPQLHRAKSAPNIPIIPLEESRRELFSTLTIRDSSYATSQTKLANLEWQQIQVAISCKDYDGALDRLERLHIAPTLLRELPFHYNRGLLNLLRYYKSHHKMYLQHARLDFNNAISACRHFYFSYLALAQIAYWMRDFTTAYNNMKALIDIFEQTHSQEGDTLLIHNSQFSGMMYLGDLYVNCALALYRLGADEVNVKEHYNYGMGILRRTHMLSHDVFERLRVEAMLKEYRRAMHPQAEVTILFGFDIQSFIQKYDAEYDAGPLQWLELNRALLIYNRRLPEYVSYQQDSGPTRLAVKQPTLDARTSTRDQHYMTSALDPNPNHVAPVVISPHQKKDSRAFMQVGHRVSNWWQKKAKSKNKC